MQTLSRRSAFLFLSLAALLWASFSLGQSGPEVRLAELTYRYVTGGIGMGEGSPAERVVFALNDSLARQMSGSIVAAINRQWGCSLPNEGMAVEKGGGLLGTGGKFKPKTRKLEPDKIHVFMRVTDFGQGGTTGFLYHLTGTQPEQEVPYLITLECKAFQGSGGEEVFSRTMQLELRKKPVPPGQYALRRVPALPKHFVQAFDSAVRRFFTMADPGSLSLNVDPVCLWVEDSVARQVRRPIRFEGDGSVVRLAENPGMEWTLGRPETRKMGRVDKTGANLLGSALTMFTGVGSEKVRVTRHLASLPMQAKEQPEPYVFHIPYLEEERESRERVRTPSGTGTTTSVQTTGDRSLERYIDREQAAWLMLGADTIARFRLDYGKSAQFSNLFRECWNGSDTATRVPMPAAWSNQGSFVPIYITGQLYGKPFTLQNSRDGFQMDMYYDGQHLATLRVTEDRPRDGMLYRNDADARVLQALAMFTCLPFSSFRINP
ncbi:MAG: hypothetical protein MUF29_08170 [Chitinophagaceae bacterium]|nr:hypothetical protein [Chitinophagaceae bacterium]